MTPGGRGRFWRVSGGLLLGALLLAVLSAPAAGATRYDPRLRFRSLKTTHFTIHYHQSEENAARRLAGLAEEVRASLEARLKLKAPRHTHVVLVDQSDVANGWTTPVPYNLIEIAIVPPAPASLLGNHDDWLRVVFTHEYAHVMHLDQVGGFMRAFRWIFGRQEVSFPNLAVPGWQVEGVATWAEGAGTALGRVHAADVASVTEARSARGAPGLSLLGGGLVAWPWGYGPYLYGGQFYEYLAARGGDDSLGELTRQTARRLPYFGAGAFKQVYGEDASTLWRDFVAKAAVDRPEGAAAESRPPSFQDPALQRAAPRAARRLTNDGYLASAPRFEPASRESARGTPGQAILYSRVTPHGFAAIWETDRAGRAPRRVVDRYDGESLTFDGDWVVYDRLEFDGPVARFSDIWASKRRTGRTVRLTRGARMADADVSPDRSRLAAVVSDAGDKALVIHALEHDAAGTPVLGVFQRRIAEPGCIFATPRWSPDGSLIAAVRHCTGSLPGIVLIRPDDGAVASVAGRRGARDVTPGWTPDGRWLMFSSDRAGDSFGLYAARVTPDPLAAGDARLLHRPPGGAMWPDVDAAGVDVVYIGATPEGLDVFAAPLPDLPTAPRDADNVQGASEAAAGGVPIASGQPGAPAVADGRPYSPWSSLLPRAWTPLLEIDGDRVDVGATVSGSDVLGRHYYWTQITTPLSRGAASPGFPEATPADWLLSYSYDRWRPTLFATASSTSDVLRVRFAGASELFTAWHRTREVSGGVLFPVRRTRWSQTFLLSADLQRRVIGLPTRDVTRHRNAVRGGWAFNSSRQFGYSISPESGARIGVTAERVLRSLGADGTATTMTADVRAYVPGGFPHAVLAVRAAAGASTGDASVRRAFTNGGTRASGPLLSFGDGAVGLVRGFGSDALAGSAAGTLNVDYRFPLLRVERGAGLWPLFVNSLHGAVFADAGSVGASLGTLAAPVWSVGAECGVVLTVGYGLRVSLAGGVAWTQQSGRSPRPDQASFFVRTGYAF